MAQNEPRTTSEHARQQPARRAVAEAVARLGSGRSLRGVILVEGLSDRHALEALARRNDVDLPASGVAVVPMRGATNVGHFLDYLGPHGLDVGLAGLYDAGEERYVARGLERAGLGRDLSRSDLAGLGFHGCVDDLEDELIRAMGTARVEQVVAAEGELEAFRTLQKQPAHRGRPVERQLRRFLGTRSGRKLRYARLLVETMDLAAMPPPLERVLAAGQGSTAR